MHWKGWALDIKTFLGPEMATSEANTISAQRHMQKFRIFEIIFQVPKTANIWKNLYFGTNKWAQKHKHKKPQNSCSEHLLCIYAVVSVTVYRHNKMCWCSRRHTRVDLCTCTCSSHWCHHLAHRGTSLCSPGLSHRSIPSFPIPTTVCTSQYTAQSWPQSMGQISIKTPNPKCRLYWC